MNPPIHALRGTMVSLLLVVLLAYGQSSGSPFPITSDLRISVRDGGFYSAIARGDSLALAAWIAWDEAGKNVYASRIALTGEVLDTVSVLLTPEGIGNLPSAGVSVEYAHGVFLVAWLERSETGGLWVCARRMRSNGELLDTNQHDLMVLQNLSHCAAFRCGPKLASSDSTFLVLAGLDDDSHSDWIYAIIDWEGPIVGRDTLSLSSWQYRNDVAYDGRDFVVSVVPSYPFTAAGTHDPVADEGVWGILVDQNLSPIGAPFEIAPIDCDVMIVSSGSMLSPLPNRICTVNGVWEDRGAAHGSGVYLICWMDEGEVMGRRVSSAGELLDSENIHIASDVSPQGSVSVVFAGTEFVVFRAQGEGTSGEIMSRRVSASGVVLSEEFANISERPGDGDGRPTAASDSLGFLCGWSGFVSDPHSFRRIFASITVDSSFLPDRVPPDLALGVLQNSYLTQYLDLYVLGSEPLESASVDLVINENDTIPVGLQDNQKLVWKGDMEVRAARETVTIHCCAVDTSGNRACDSLVFSSTFLPAAWGGKAGSVDGKMVLTVGSGALERDAFVLILPVTEETDPRSPINKNEPRQSRIDATGGRGLRAGYRVSPRQILRTTAAITFRYVEEDLLGHTPDCLYVEEVGCGGLQSLVDPAAKRVTATVSELGAFRLAIGSPGSSRLADPLFLSAEPNVPNPFNPATTIRFEVRQPQRVSVSAFDVSGRLVAELFDGRVGVGPQGVTWDGRSTDGKEASSGVYFSRIETEHKSITRKMTLLQ